MWGKAAQRASPISDCYVIIYVYMINLATHTCRAHLELVNQVNFLALDVIIFKKSGKFRFSTNS